MSIQSNAKSTFHVGRDWTNSISTLAEFEAVDWIEVGEVEDLGEFGVEGSIQDFLSLKDGYKRKLVGSKDSGTIALVVGRDPSDPGQKKLNEAAMGWEKYPIKVTLNDKPTPTGEPTVFYMRVAVASAKGNFGTADNIVKTTYSLAIDGAILELPAEANATISPAAGPLPAATSGSSYSTSISASGGLGSAVFAVTSGALPAGLTLNASTGVISGTPSTTGTSNFVVTATYSGSGQAEAAYSITVA